MQVASSGYSWTNSMKETRESDDFARTGFFRSTGGILYPSLYNFGRTESNASARSSTVEGCASLRRMVPHVPRELPRSVHPSRRGGEWMDGAADRGSALRRQR